MFFFLNEEANAVIYTLSLHDALPICGRDDLRVHQRPSDGRSPVKPANLTLTPAQIVAELDRYIVGQQKVVGEDRKSTRLNSSHVEISYAVFRLKKKTCA